jgi:hypothetical protein
MIIVRYELRSAVSFLPIIYRFKTQMAANNFLDKHLPQDAQNLSIWVEADEEPRQKPTFAYAPKTYTPWWDANKRPFADRYELEGERS